MRLRDSDRLDRDHVGRPRRKQHELVGKHDRLAGIVGDEDARWSAAACQTSSRSLRKRSAVRSSSETNGSSSSRRSGLVAKARASATRRAKPERQLLGIARQHVGNADGLRQMLQIGRAEARRGDQLDILPHGAPGQQARLLEHDADARAGWHIDLADETVVQSGDDAQQRGLAAAGRAHQHRHALGLDLEHEVADGRHQRAVSADVSLLLDADFKPACYASVLNIVQGVAPVNIRWPA